MPKLNLDKTYIHRGKFYGPGETEVPDEAAKDIQAKTEAAPKATPPPRLDSTAAGQQHPSDGPAEVQASDEKPAGGGKAAKGKK
jgi:hypothetical protein